MKKLITVIAVVSVLALGTLAFAHGTGGWGGGYMMGPGYGGHDGSWLRWTYDGPGCSDNRD